jgi:hypothetical protein
MGSARAPLLSPMMRVFTRLFSLVIGQVDTDVLHRPGSPTGLPLLVWRTTKVDFKQSACIPRCDAIVCIQLHCTSRQIWFAMRTCGRRTGASRRVGVGSLTAAVSEVAVVRASHFGNLSRRLRLACRHWCQERPFAPGCSSTPARGMRLASPLGRRAALGCLIVLVFDSPAGSESVRPAQICPSSSYKAAHRIPKRQSRRPRTLPRHRPRGPSRDQAKGDEPCKPSAPT